MSSNPLFYDATEIAVVNTRAALLNSGYMNLYTGAQPALDGALTGTLLASLRFGATAFGAPAAAAGVVTAAANQIQSAIAGANGVAGYFAVLKSDGVTVVAIGTVGTSGADMNMSSLQILAGQVVACGAFSLTQPQT